MDDDKRATEASDEEVAEELGYSDCDWSRLPRGSAERHDAIMEMELDALEALDLASLDDLGKWAAAQCFDDFGQTDRFHELSLALVRTKKKHPALDYSEICLELFNDYLLDEQWDDAVFLLPDIERLLDDDETARARYGALVNVLRGRTDDGLAVFQELAEEYEDDALALLTLADDLLRCERVTEALSLLDKAEEIASIENDRELLDEIAESRAFARGEGKYAVP
ncbi:MAG: hypothetical protein H6698_07240 [Myxococcales bacterium]|nr:hypothetical protein [Myxococcales bacterium]MCB9534100.1 hypothetical protein [Myxococcales bacterium]